MIWLVGSGIMAIDYARVLEGIQQEYIVIGRGENSAAEFSKKINKDVVTGGLQNYLETKPKIANYAIVSVGVEELYNATSSLIEYGIKNILIEKPAGLNKEEIIKLSEVASSKNVKVFVAYNRRFYSSVIEAKKIIQQDNGVISYNFEFTEWKHEIEKLKKPDIVKQYWYLANSSHVVDLAFYLGGTPREICCYHAGNNTLDWHPSASIFCGSGISENNALFSYHANWIAPGRWSVEILTNKHRLIFKPLEELRIQKLASVEISTVAIDDELDKQYKPGLYLQTIAFLNGDVTNLCMLEDHAGRMDLFYNIAGYK